MEEQHTMEPRGEDTGSQSILEFGSSLIQSKRGTIHVLTIVGQIEPEQISPEGQGRDEGDQAQGRSNPKDNLKHP